MGQKWKVKHLIVLSKAEVYDVAILMRSLQCQ